VSEDKTPSLILKSDMFSGSKKKRSKSKEVEKDERLLFGGENLSMSLRCQKNADLPVSHHQISTWDAVVLASRFIDDSNES
jgi:hypothetical protein